MGRPKTFIKLIKQAGGIAHRKSNSLAFLNPLIISLTHTHKRDEENSHRWAISFCFEGGKYQIITQRQLKKTGEV